MKKPCLGDFVIFDFFGHRIEAVVEKQDSDGNLWTKAGGDSWKKIPPHKIMEQPDNHSQDQANGN